MSDALIQVFKSNKSGVYTLIQDGEQVGEIDMFDVECIDLDALEALAASAAHAYMDRGGR